MLQYMAEVKEKKREKNGRMQDDRVAVRIACTSPLLVGGGEVEVTRSSHSD